MWGSEGLWRQASHLPEACFDYKAPEKKQSSSSLLRSSCGEGGEKKEAKCALRLCLPAAGEQGTRSPASLVNPDGNSARGKKPPSSGAEDMCSANYLGRLLKFLDATCNVWDSGRILSFGGNSLPYTHCGWETLTNHGQICIPLFGAYSGNSTAACFLFIPQKGSVEILHAVVDL